jgi:phosphomannomutase / phosphoglucomutase
VVGNGADLGLGFDGDGDRCGVVDETGEAIFADKIGVLLARDLSGVNPGAVFIADIKSTGLFATDPVLKRNGAVTEYWKTGHSYIKRRVGERGALAGFEKSGHFFFNAPIGRGYDDGVVSAIAVLDMLDRKPDMSMSDLRHSLPRTWGSPTMAAHCRDEDKYALAERVERRFAEMQRKGESLAGHAIAELVTINGVRVRCDDGTWGLVRASSNKPELIVVIESPVSEARLRDMFAAVDRIVRNEGEVGSYNQTI